MDAPFSGPSLKEMSWMTARCDLPNPRLSHSPQPGPHEIESSRENAAPKGVSYLESVRKVHQ